MLPGSSSVFAAYRFSGGWRLFIVALLRPLLWALLGRRWRGRDMIPRRGGVILAANHLSEADPLALGHFVYKAGRFPVFLAKDALFRVPLVGALLAASGQIPVARGTEGAARSLEGARAALAAGQCVIFYPEGTCTRDPLLWPMRAKTGAARLALETGAPVIPVAQWGAHELLPYRSGGLRLLPRKTMRVAAGAPVDLTAYAEAAADADTLRAATDEIMRKITGLLGELREQAPPERPYVHEERRQT
ncbi:lysophospholipid acyltransferase family protein [Actinocorallia sp. A-T 12471]|uniref:lysophospholipid acyltransferase family protein n=1 Tax=Actinocorallia sp. A-T 12471 TaxID=3089813 RepID=UPI0029D2D8F2|nr:lysophospholipid acyltransferase family protein [Actinocorallia sp. A-T 12471]MDX6739079.1 lysophospholipid acyltransferase family protein [Actinocorallia sp. A-T 12471]